MQVKQAQSLALERRQIQQYPQASMFTILSIDVPLGTQARHQRKSAVLAAAVAFVCVHIIEQKLTRPACFGTYESPTPADSSIITTINNM